MASPVVLAPNGTPSEVTFVAHDAYARFAFALTSEDVDADVTVRVIDGDAGTIERR